MQTKLQLYQEVSEQASKRLWSDTDYFRSFLVTSARLYKYCFKDQIMIHDQRPNAVSFSYLPSVINKNPPFKVVIKSKRQVSNKLTCLFSLLFSFRGVKPKFPYKNIPFQALWVLAIVGVPCT